MQLSTLIAAIVGTFAGGFIGFTTAAILAASGRASEMERAQGYDNEHTN